MGETLVLIVDDDDDVRDGIRDILVDEGFGVAVARDGADALSQLRAGLRADVIVLDAMMPVMGGAEFREVQLKDAGLASIPVIMCSADLRADLPGPRVHALAKPFGLNQLLGTLALALRRLPAA